MYIFAAHGFARVIPVVCLYAGEVDMLERVKDAVMVYQTNPLAIRFVMAGASLLESVLLGKDLRAALESAMEQAMSSSSNFSLDDSDIGDAYLYSLMEAKMKDIPQLMEGLEEDESQGGRTARCPSPFIVNIFTFYKAIGDGDINEDAYVKAIRANIMAGGDTCCRAILMGAVLGAAAGSVPQSFVDKFPKETMEKVDKAIKGILESLD
jgi:ADP-ribosylglycohydrolase